MAETFAATVSAWATAERERQEAIFKEAAQRVVREMQKPRGDGGRIPVVTGFLRSSLLATNTEMPVMRREARPEPGRTYVYGGQVSLVINATKLGQTIYVGYVAAYARRLEYGFTGQDSLGRNYNQRPIGWVRGAAALWPQIVKDVEEEARGGTVAPAAEP